MFDRKAFTLIELLVVIAIIGILSGMIVISMGGSTDKATIAKSQVFFNSLRAGLMSNISAEWKFDEGSGTNAQDTWWKTANGTITNATYNTTSCVYSSCLNFDGTAYVTVAHNNAPAFTSAMTAMGWVKGVSQSKIIIGQWDDSSQRSWIIYSAADKLRVMLSVDGANISKDYMSTTSIAFDNKWHLVGFTYNAGTLTLYIDGAVVAATTSVDGTCNSLFNSSANLTIGCGLSGGTPVHLFIGSIDDTRLFNAQIPTSQIQEQYYAGLNNLLASGEISADEYSQRISTLSLNK
ncbi:MAG: LamG-like jellyroll fold domain-containing protein [Candidatus Paceibacterota bacterium]|jgi:prepilin-type N-terminal cleavage/methylation domain-containing protein